MLASSATDHLAGYLQAIQSIGADVGVVRGSFDRERRLPESIFKKLADAGLFRLWLPVALDGPELGPLDFMRVVEAAAALDGTIGWLVGNGGGMSRVGGYLPNKTTQPWFQDTDAFVATSTVPAGTATPVEGGYRVNGRWPFGSGSHHATQFMGLCNIKAEDGQERPMMCCYFAREKVTIHDTWHVSGLRGTGSCDFEVRDVFVPSDHAHGFLALHPTQPGLLYRMPTVLVFRWTVATVPLGIARGAITTFKELVSRKKAAPMAALLRDRETVQATVGRAEALHRAGRAFLVEAMTELMAATHGGGNRLDDAQAVLQLACAHAAESAVHIVDMLAADTGALAISESCSLERAVRDAHAAAKHVAMSPNSYIIAGRRLLGLEPLH